MNHALDPARRRRAGELSPIPAPINRSKSTHRDHQYAAAECLSGDARHLQLGVSERILAKHTESADYSAGIPVGGPAVGPGDAAGFAGAGDGSEPAGWSATTVTPASTNCLSWSSPTTRFRPGASARRLRAPVRRRRQCVHPRRAANRASLLDSFREESRNSNNAWACRSRAVDQYLDSVRGRARNRACRAGGGPRRPTSIGR